MADHTVHHVHEEGVSTGDNNIVAAVILLLVVLAVAAFIVFAFGGSFRFAPATTQPSDVNVDVNLPTNQGSQIPTE